jgi:hypothetical protein
MYGLCLLFMIIVILAVTNEDNVSGRAKKSCADFSTEPILLENNNFQFMSET